jgi:hypothetical protein
LMVLSDGLFSCIYGVYCYIFYIQVRFFVCIGTADCTCAIVYVCTISTLAAFL